MVGTRIAPDNNDIVVWKFDEASGTFVNSSTSPSAISHATSDLTSFSGDFIRQAPSPFAATGTNSCVFFTGDNSGSPRNTIFGANNVEPQAPLTFSCWMNLRSYGNTGFVQHFFTKQNTAGVWSGGTFGTVGMQNASVGSSIFNLFLPITQVTSEQQFTVPLNVWCHYGVTWDGTTVTNFLNGSMVAQWTATGSLNYGGHGPWFFGAIPSGSGNPEETPFAICDFRIANIARTQSYFQNIYQNAILNAGSTIAIATTFYKMRAYDSFLTNTPVYWVDTQISYANAPASPSGLGLGPIEILESWPLLNTT